MRERRRPGRHRLDRRRRQIPSRTMTGPRLAPRELFHRLTPPGEPGRRQPRPSCPPRQASLPSRRQSRGRARPVPSHLPLPPRLILQNLERLLPERRRTNPTSVPITYTSQDQVEVYRFSLPAAIAIPIIALFLQVFVPL